MEAYETLHAAIDSYIKANGNKEITGTVLNDILNAMVSALGADTRFAGVAVPSTNPGNPEGNVVYFASQAGTYSNFGGIVLPLGIHIFVWNGNAWTSQTWFSVDNTPTQNSQNLVTSGGIFQAIVDAVGVERLRAIGAEVTSCSFNSTTKKVSFFNSVNTTLFQLDATAFIIDGMVSDVKIEDGNLVIKFNTDAGKQDIEIPLTDIFNPANYYTKTAIDALLALYYTKTETNALLTAINNKLADGCLYRGMAEPTTNPPTSTTKVFYIATKAGTYTNFGNIAVTDGITILKYDGSNWSKEQISYSDGVFDISAYHATGGTLATYADLSAALDSNNDGGVPQSLQKGGMSIKFVQSSDNKYVQYRCIADDFTTNVSKWAICDDGVYIENSEYSKVITDRNGRVACGITADGRFVWAKGVPNPIKEYFYYKIKELGLLDVEKITAFLGNLINGSDDLTELLNSKVDGHYIENDEYLEVKTDANNKVLGGIKYKNVNANKEIYLQGETKDITLLLQTYVTSPCNIYIKGVGKAVISQSVELRSSNVHIFVDKTVTMYLADSVYAPMIVTPGSQYNWDSPMVDKWHLYNISIDGGVWDFNATGNTLSGSYEEGKYMSDYVGISIVDVTNFQLKNCKLLGAWKFSFLGSNLTYSYFNNIELQTGAANQDGLHFEGKINYCLIDNVYGTTANDDFIGMNCGGDIYLPHGKNIKRKGDSRFITIRNIRTKSNIRLLNGSEHVMDYVLIENVTSTVFISCYGQDAIYGNITIANCNHYTDYWYVGNATFVRAGGSGMKRTTKIKSLTLQNVNTVNRALLRFDDCEIDRLIINDVNVEYKPDPRQPYNEVFAGALIFTDNSTLDDQSLQKSEIKKMIVSNMISNDISEYSDGNGHSYTKNSYLVDTDEIGKLIVSNAVLGVSEICDTNVVVPETSCVDLL